MTPAKGALKALVSRLRRPEPVPYLAVYVIRNEDFRRALDSLSSLAGPLLTQVVTEPDGRKLLVINWSSQERFACESPQVASALATDAMPLQGWVNDFRHSKDPWWRRIKPTTWLLSAAALAGAFEVVNNRFDRLFATPSLSVKMDRMAIDVVHRDALEVPITVVNRLPDTPHSKLSIHTVLKAPDGKEFRLDADEPNIPVLSGGDTWTVSMHGIAPTPGRYTVSTTVNSKAGALKASQDTRARPSTVIVWPSEPTGTLQFLRETTDGARFEGQITVGKSAPRGLNCELLIAGIPGLLPATSLDIEGIQGRFLSLVAGDGPHSSFRLSWKLASVNAMTIRPFTVILRSSRDVKWTTVPERSEIICYQDEG